MGWVSFTNSIGIPVIIEDFSINGNNFPWKGTNVTPGDTISSEEYSGNRWNEFDRLIISFYVQGKLFHIDLNKDHYFKGGDYHYPGTESDVWYTLLGISTTAEKILVALGYRKNTGKFDPKTNPIYLYSGDFTKFFDRR